MADDMVRTQIDIIALRTEIGRQERQASDTAKQLALSGRVDLAVGVLIDAVTRLEGRYHDLENARERVRRSQLVGNPSA